MIRVKMVINVKICIKKVKLLVNNENIIHKNIVTILNNRFQKIAKKRRKFCHKKLKSHNKKYILNIINKNFTKICQIKTMYHNLENNKKDMKIIKILDYVIKNIKIKKVE